MPDSDVLGLLRRRPKEVKQLKSRDAYRSFFTGMSKSRMLRLLREAAPSHSGDAKAREARIARRMALLDDVLVDGGGGGTD